MRRSVPGPSGEEARPQASRSNRRADRARFLPESEELETRWLPSGAGHLVHADLLSPPAVEVANATSILEAQAGQDFQKLAADLGRVEQASGVRPGQFLRSWNTMPPRLIWRSSRQAYRPGSRRSSSTPCRTCWTSHFWLPATEPAAGRSSSRRFLQISPA